MEARTVRFVSAHIADAASLLARTGNGSGPDTADPVAAYRRVEEWASRQPAGCPG